MGDANEVTIVVSKNLDAFLGDGSLGSSVLDASSLLGLGLGLSNGLGLASLDLVVGVGPNLDAAAANLGRNLVAEGDGNASIVEANLVGCL